ncbi:MAG: hypothetical protein N2595_05015, partial [bacterium]|nr:hypothetical protein [bacterium]
MPRTEIREAQLWISRDDLATELRQCVDEGKDVSTVRGRFEELMALDEEELRGEAAQAECCALLDRCAGLPQIPGYPYVEPETLEEIRAECGEGFVARGELSDERIYDSVHGAILGRCIGCLLGQPVETVRRAQLWPCLLYTS